MSLSLATGSRTAGLGALVLGAIASFGLQAATVAWDAGGDGASWHDPLNWSGDTLPGAADNVVIDLPGAVVAYNSTTAVTTIASLVCPRELRLTFGSLTITGEAVFSGGTLRLLGGTFSGAPRIISGRLEAKTLNAPATFEVFGSSELMNAVAAPATVRVQGNNTFGDAAVAWTGLQQLQGELRLESLTDARNVTVGGAAGNTCTIESTGRLVAAAGAGGRRVFSYGVRNWGRISVTGGVVLELSGPPAPGYFQRGGGAVETDAASTFQLSTYMTDIGGGTISGRMVAHTDELVTSGTATGPSPLIVCGLVRLLEHSATNLTVVVQGNNQFGNATLQANLDDLLPDTLWPIVPVEGPIRFETVDSTWRITVDARRGALVVKPTGSLTFTLGAGGPRDFPNYSILQNYGRITVDPGMAVLFPTSYFGNLGGVTEGEFLVRNAQSLNFGPAPAVPTELVLIGDDNHFGAGEGQIPPNQTVRLRGDNTGGNAALSLSKDVTVQGRILLDSQDSAWSARLTALPGATLRVKPDGRLNATAGSGGLRILNGAVVNEGAVTVAANRLLRQENDPPPSFTQVGGSLEVGAGGRFEQRVGTFLHRGGTVSGDVVVANGSLDVAATVTEPTTLVLAGQQARLLGNASPAVTAWLRGGNDFGEAILNLAGPVVNRGTLRLESVDGPWHTRILCADGASLVNEGQLNVNAGTGGIRRFEGSFVHRGSLGVAPDYGMEFRGAFEADGGSISGPHDLLNIALRLTTAPAVPTVFRVTGEFGQLLTDIPAGFHLRLLGDNRYGPARLIAPGNVSNGGRLELVSVDGPWNSTFELTTGGLLNTPGATLELGTGAGGRRHVTAPLDNRGSVIIGPGVEAYLGRGSATSRNHGAFTGGNSYVQFAGPFVNLAGATASLAGAVRAPYGFFNDGTLQVGGPGTAAPLTVFGPFTQGAVARLELDVLGAAAGTGYDQLLQQDGALSLAGVLAVNAAGFTPAAGATFDVVSAQQPLVGAFSPVTGLSLGANLSFNPDYSANLLRLTATVRPGDLTPPLITHQPTPRFAGLGESAAFTVEASGSAPFTYQWFRNGGEILGATAATYPIASVGGGDYAGYSCRVANAAGSVFTLTVSLEPPGVTIPVADAVRTTLPPVEGDGVLLELFNGVGGDVAPTAAALTGIAPSGTVFAPVIDFPHPGQVANVGGQFELFFADTATPPAEVLGLSAANFTLRHSFLLRVAPDLDLDPVAPGIQLVLGVGSDDGFDLRAGSQSLGSSGPRGFTYTWMNVTFADKGLYPVTLLFAANAVGQSGLEFSWKAAAAPAGQIVPQAALYSSPDIGDRKVTFEELPAGTTVTDQFAGEGVVFNATQGLVITDAKPAKFVPQSGDRVFGDPAEAGAAAGVVELEFVVPETGAHGVTDFVRLFVVDAETTGAVVTAFDPDGAVLTTRELHGGAGAQERVLLRHANIAKVRVTLGSGTDTAAIDSLVFTTPMAFNRPPTLAAIDDKALDEGRLLTFTATGTDADGDPLTYGLVPPAPSGAMIDPVTGVFTWTPNEAQGPATVPITVSVTDDQIPPGAATRTFQVTVSEVNLPPVFPPIPDQEFDTLGTVSFPVGAIDPDIPSTLAYRYDIDPQTPGKVHMTPANTYVDPLTGNFVWQVPEDAHAGIYEGRIFVSDGQFELSQRFAVRLTLIPDLIVAALTGPAEVATLETAPVTVRVRNVGSQFAKPTKLKLWLSRDDVLGADDLDLVANGSPDLLPGASSERALPVRWPNVTGSFRVIAAVDAPGDLVEKSEENNLLVSAGSVNIVPAYTATVRAGVNEAPMGTPVVFTGAAIRRDGSPAALEVVNLHLRSRGYTRVLGVLTDVNGQFTHTFQPLPDEAGSYSVGATHPGVSEFAEQDSFQLIGLGFEPKELALTVPALRRTTNFVTLVNRSELPLTSFATEFAGVPAGIEVTLQLPASLAGDASVEVPLVVNSTVDAAASAHLTVSVLGSVGPLNQFLASTVLPVALNVAPQRAILVANPPELSATVIRSNQTVVTFTVRNEGSLDSPAIDLTLPAIPWLGVGSITPLPPLRPGAETAVTLTLQPGGDVPVGNTAGTIVAGNAATAVAVPFIFRVRDDTLGTLTVEAVDEYTFYAPGSPRLTNVPVVLKDRTTGLELARTNTDAGGLAKFTGLAEGVYELSVSADRHTGFDEPVNIIAGEDQSVQAFLARHNVEYRFRVEETGIEDRTRLVVETVFETRAPIPVLTIEPAFVDLRKYRNRGGSIEFKLCNVGVLAAQHLSFGWQNGGPFVFKPLARGLGDLGGESCITVPVKIYLDADRDGKHDRPTGPRDPDAGGDPANDPEEGEETGESETDRAARGDCPGSPTGCFTLECGDKVYQFCTSGSVSGDCADDGLGVGDLGFRGDAAATYSSSSITPTEQPPCDPCVAEIAKIYAGCYFNILVPGALENAQKFAEGDTSKVATLLEPWNADAAKCLGSYIERTQTLTNGTDVAANFVGLYKLADDCGFKLTLGNNPEATEAVDAEVAAAVELYDKGLKKYLQERIEKFNPSADDAIKATVTALAADSPYVANIIEAMKCLKQLACSCRTGLKCPESLSDIGKAMAEDLGRPIPPWVNMKLFDKLFEPSDERVARHATRPPFFPGQLGVRDQFMRLYALLSVFEAYYGDLVWVAGRRDENYFLLRTGLIVSQDPAGDEGRRISAIEKEVLDTIGLPDGFSRQDVDDYVARWNRTLEYYERGWFNTTDVPAGHSGDFLAADKILLANFLAELALDMWDRDGQLNHVKAVFDAVRTLKQNVDESAAGAGVCARLRLRLSQDAVQTRQGFTATLELDNNDTEPMTGLSVVLDLRDANGAPVTESQFAALRPEVTGLTAIDGSGQLAPAGKGSVAWVIVPSHEAAPTNAPVRYAIGATLVYQQGGNTLTVPMTPAPITVFPQPRLHVAYFHERDVFADDPFTEPVEPSIPYSLAVRVENRGFGTARALRIESSQPKIVENDKGLFIDFNLFATEVAGVGVTPALTAEFGDLAPGTSKTARWLFRSSLQGQFIDYSATFQHLGALSSLPEFSIVESTEIHEMIHLVRVEGADADGALDFLVNDRLDDEFLPDVVHFSQGGSAPASTVRAGTFDIPPGVGPRELTLHATVPAGYVYFRLPDPANGQWRVTGLKRADGTTVASENIWQTDRTFIAGARQPRRENMLHFFDRVSAAGPVTYRFDFTAAVTLAQADSVTRPAGECLTISTRDLLANDTSANGRLRVIEVLSGDGAASGRATLGGGGIRYEPSAAGDVDDAFTYTIQDAVGAVSTATVTVRVGPPIVPTTNEVVVRDDGCGPVVLLYRGEAGRRYAVEMTGDLNANSWQTVVENAADLLGLLRLDLAEPAGETAQRFYRVSGPLGP